MESIFRPLAPDEAALMQAKIEELYDTFLDRVSRGRHMTKADVDAVGRGRVWTGQSAYRLGLVDKLGGLREALDEARRVAGLPDDAPVVELPSVGPSLLDKAKAALTLLSLGSADASALLALPEQIRSVARAIAPMMVYASYAPLARLEWVPVGE
jgi:protease-4